MCVHFYKMLFHFSWSYHPKNSCTLSPFLWIALYVCIFLLNVVSMLVGPITLKIAVLSGDFHSYSYFSKKIGYKLCSRLTLSDISGGHSTHHHQGPES